ncbi:MAG: hypothetical protein WA421_09615 [Nitrososphaeraceae archaeon]
MSSKSEQKLLGIVKNGSFVSADTKNTMLLTTVHMQEARTPESGKIDLREYEGKAILVSYQQISDVIVYAAEVANIAGPILTLVIKKIFDLD